MGFHLSGLVRSAVLAVVAAAASAQPDVPEGPRLGIGDAAPELAIGEWVKGEPVERLEGGVIHVVEFWATWCGPCLESIPHLTETQRRLGERVRVVGVTASDPNNTPEVVRAFVDAKGDTMGYTVAIDDDRRTFDAYMRALGMNGIPTAFIVSGDGRIAYIGHPLEPAFDTTLDALHAGSFDWGAAREAREKLAAALDAEMAREVERERVMQAARPLISRLLKAWGADDAPTALALADEVVAINPALLSEFAVWKLNALLMIDRDEEAWAYGRSLLEGTYRADAETLRRLATIVSESLEPEKPDMDLALALADRSVELTRREDVESLTTLASVRYYRGEVAEAVSDLERAVDVARDAAQAERLRAMLEIYRSELPVPEDTGESPGGGAEGAPGGSSSGG